MAEVDTSIYKPVAQPDPLATAGNYASLATALQQSKLLGQETAARAGVSDAVRAATDPATGQLDTSKLFGAAPGAGYLAPGLIQSGLAIQKGQQDLAAGQMNDLATGLGAVLQANPNMTHEDATGLVNSYLLHNRVSAKIAADTLKEMPTDETPGALASYVRTRFIAAQPQGGGTPGSTIGVGPKGEVIQGTVGQAVAKSLGGPSGGTVAAAGAPGTPAPNAGQGIVTSLPIGRSTALEGAAATSVQQAKALSDEAEGYNNKVSILQNMERHLDNFTSGPTADWTREMKAMANRWGFNFDTEGTAAQENFQKLATQLAISQSQTMGVSTNSKLSTAVGANPNTDYSNLGNAGIIHMLRGNADAGFRKNTEWQAAVKAGKVSPENYSQWSSDFNSSFDPRVFQFKYMTPKERNQVWSAMSPDDQKDFRQRLQEASDKGWVKPDGK